MTTDPLLQWREMFPILSQTTYLVSHSLGAMPRTVYDSLRAYADTWARRGVMAWSEGWFEMNGEIGNLIGSVMGAPDGSVVVHQNASLAIAILMSALDFSDTRRNKVIITDMIFPSDYYALQGALPPHMDIHIVKSRDGITVDTQEIIDAIDERTRLVWLNHVLFRSGFVMPAAPIIEKAHQVGAQVGLDGYHAVGIIPVDVTALNVDFYIGGVLKWMCGGPGGVFMYIRPDWLPQMRPKITGWFAHPHPFDFEVGQMAYRDDIYRMMNGTPGIASLYAIKPGVEVIREVGVATIREKSKQMTALIIALAQAEGYTIRTPLDPEQRGGMVVVEPPHAYEVSEELRARNYLVDYRPKAGIRIAPHFYNTEEEVRAVMAQIKEILASGAWQKHASGRAFVT